MQQRCLDGPLAPLDDAALILPRDDIGAHLAGERRMDAADLALRPSRGRPEQVALAQVVAVHDRPAAGVTADPVVIVVDSELQAQIAGNLSRNTIGVQIGRRQVVIARHCETGLDQDRADPLLLEIGELRVANILRRNRMPEPIGRRAKRGCRVLEQVAAADILSGSDLLQLVSP